MINDELKDRISDTNFTRGKPTCCDRQGTCCTSNQPHGSRSAADGLLEAQVIHELRHALSPLTLAVALLDNPGLDDDAFKTAKQIIARQAKQITRLVNDLWDARWQQQGAIQIERRPLDLVEIVQKVCEAHEVVFQKRGLQLRWNVPNGVAPVLGDADRLAQILTSLLVNAAQFTRPGGRVDVDLLLDQPAGRVITSVRDTGLGVDASSLPHLFDRYYQNRQAVPRRSGRGLGLSIVKTLVELHEGQVWAESRGIGRGATFQFWLPLHLHRQIDEAAMPRPPCEPDWAPFLLPTPMVA